MRVFLVLVTAAFALAAQSASAALPSDWTVTRTRTPVSFSLVVQSDSRGLTLSRVENIRGEIIVGATFFRPQTGAAGTCFFSNAGAMLQTTAPLPPCDPYQPKTWSSHCAMPPLCPAGSANNQDSYVCGDEGATCPCAPVNSPAAYASLCGDETSLKPLCVPLPDNYAVPPTPLQSPEANTIMANIESLARSNDQTISSDFQQALDRLGQETRGCTTTGYNAR